MKIFLLAFRTFMRFRLYTIINVIGLALGLACFILINRYNYRELSTDSFIQDSERVCLLTTEIENNEKCNLWGLYDHMMIERTPLKDPAVEMFSVYRLMGESQIVVDDKDYNVTILVADSNFLKIITYPILKATSKPLLKRPNDAVITRQLASKLFGKEDPIGKMITSPIGLIVTVTGVLDEPSSQVSLPFDLLLSEELTDWSKMVGVEQVVKLLPGSDYRIVNQKYAKYLKYSYTVSRLRLNLYPIRQLYFDKELVTYLNWRRVGNMAYVWILAIIGGLILTLGVFNFINIYTVILQKRGRELGMKKVFGVNRWQIGIQLYVENFCMILLALFIAQVFIEIGSNLAFIELGLLGVQDGRFNGALSAGILFLLPLITSLYPFWKYQYTTPIDSLRAIGKNGISAVSRSFFLCGQYVITIFFIILSIMLIKQLYYMQNIPLGFDTEDVLEVQVLNTPQGEDREMWRRYHQMEAKLSRAMSQSPFFLYYDYCASPVETNHYSHSFYTVENKKADLEISYMTENFFHILNIKPLAGRFWKDSIDVSTDMQILLNESACKMLGIKDITQEELLTDREVIRISTQTYTYPVRYRIIGVVPDHQTGHLSGGIAPTAYFYHSAILKGILLKTVPGKKKEAISYLQSIYNENGGDALSYRTLEDHIEQLYAQDRQLMYITSTFAVIAMLISALGLFSISLFDIQQRFHEIAIRKVNGATSIVIYKLLLKKYLRLLLFSALIAMPVSWCAVTAYLVDYVYRTELSWWIFVVAVGFTAGISVLTLSFQIRKASCMNPSDAIRNE